MSVRTKLLLLALVAFGCDDRAPSATTDGGVPTDTDAGAASESDAGAPYGDGDGDGLDAADEAALGTDPNREDTDGDGVGDGVEVVAGTDPLDPSSTIAPTDYYVVLPYEAPPVLRTLDFTARLGRGDIVFLVDTTGSMHEPINNVRRSLSRTIAPRIREAFADAWMGVAEFQDFPVSPYGGETDVPFRSIVRPTPDLDAVQTALDGLTLGDGGDQDESLIEGIYGVATTPGFRHDAQSIVVAITDAGSHNAPNGLPYYDQLVTARSYAETLAVMRSRSLAFVGVSVPMLGQDIAGEDLRDIGRDSGSLGRDGEPVVLDAPGGGVSSSIVSGIAEMVRSQTQDVTSRLVDDPSDALDATGFIRRVTPLRAQEAARLDESTFYGVAGGTSVTFEVELGNDIVPPGPEVQIFVARIELHEPGAAQALDTRQVFVVVPREDGGLI